MEAEVFEKDCLAVFERVALSFGIGTYYVLCKSNLAAEQFVESCGNGSEGKFNGLFLACFSLYGFGSGFACFYLFLILLVELEGSGEDGVGFAEVGAKGNFCAVFEQIFDGGKSALYSVFVGYLAVLHGDVEVATYKYFFAFEILEVFDRHFVHKKQFSLNQ